MILSTPTETRMSSGFWSSLSVRRTATRATNQSSGFAHITPNPTSTYEGCTSADVTLTLNEIIRCNSGPYQPEPEDEIFRDPTIPVLLEQLHTLPELDDWERVLDEL